MRVISVRTLRNYWVVNPLAEQPLKAWYQEAIAADWKTFADVKAKYGNASVIANNRAVFNIKGNDYRLIVAIAYKVGIIYIKFVGTHVEYDAVDAATVAME